MARVSRHPCGVGARSEARAPRGSPVMAHAALVLTGTLHGPVRGRHAVRRAAPCRCAGRRAPRHEGRARRRARDEGRERRCPEGRHSGARAGNEGRALEGALRSRHADDRRGVGRVTAGEDDAVGRPRLRHGPRSARAASDDHVRRGHAVARARERGRLRVGHPPREAGRGLRRTTDPSRPRFPRAGPPIRAQTRARPRAPAQSQSPLPALPPSCRSWPSRPSA